MDDASRADRPSWTRAGITALTLLALARFAAAIIGARSPLLGDFYQTLPGPYVERLNPLLWNSPDLKGAAAYHANYYLYGPTQYLTLYPIAYLNSYAQIATVLLFVYVPVVAAGIVLLWRSMTHGESSAAGLWPALCASLLFLPLIQCVVQREFEVVGFLSLCAGVYGLIAGRRFLAGGVFGYITWFKFLPLPLLAYVAIRRWWTAILGFAAASMVVLSAAQLIFGLDRFVLLNPKIAPVSHIASTFVNDALLPLVEGRPSFFATYATEHGPALGGTGFCDRWEEVNGTMVSLRWALCGINARHLWFPSRELFFVIVLVLVGAALLGFLRHLQRPHTPLEDKWRTLWEVSLVVFGSTFLVRAHVHYEIALLLPIVALIYRYAGYGAGTLRWGLLGASYLLLSGFVIPASILSAVLRTNFWRAYMGHQLYMYGQMLLVGLVLREYIPRR